MKGGHLDARRVEQLRLERIEKGMPEFVAHDVGTLAGKDRPSRGRTMEELQALAVIEGIEVDTEIEIHRQDGAHHSGQGRKLQQNTQAAYTAALVASSPRMIRASFMPHNSPDRDGSISRSAELATAPPKSARSAATREGGGSAHWRRRMPRKLNEMPLAAFVMYCRTGQWIVASRADEYRRRAQQCLEMAAVFKSPQARNCLSHMAQAWLRLADNYKARPVVQQQQQIRPKERDS